ncbi:MAG: ABC transporter substrate-binding protein [Chloroflexi bacterium]|nr:ABC transporter substrate-binding protein [Chloroflexota bacterium]
MTAYYVIPIYMAIAKGYFDKAGLDVNMELAKQTNLTVPRLSKGELDIADTSAKPPLFNQVAEGFNARIISSTTIFRSGRVANTWLSVDPAKANQFHELGDLKGTTVEAGLEGSALDQFVSQGLEQAGLKLGKDVNITFRAKGPSDMLALARSHAADVIVMPEPVATQAESEGLLKRWKSDADLIPWYQALYLVASDHFRTSNRPALVKFLEVYLASAREVNASNGTWQDDVLQTTAKQTTIDADVLKKMGGVPLSEPNGAVSMDSLTRTQDLWVGRGLVKQPVKDFGQLVDTSPLDEALQAIGRAPAP